MLSFEYDAYDNQGGKVKGIVEAKTETEAYNHLQEKGLTPVSVSPQKKTATKLFNKSKVGLKELEFFTSEVSLLLRSGLRIDKAIAVLAKSKEEPALRELLNGILSSLKGGKSLSETFRNKPDVFDPLYCNLIELAEETGELSRVFADLAKDLAFKRELRAKISGALIYPGVIFCVCLLSIVFIFNVIIPKMSTMFDEVAALPWYTQLLIGLSNWMTNYQWFLLGALGIVVFAIVYLLKLEQFKLKLQQLSLSFPIAKTFIINIERIRFNSALAMMLRSGVAIDRALQLGTGSVKNSELQAQLTIARKKVKNGESLVSSLGQTPFFSGVYLPLLEVGEQTGTLDVVFEDIARRSKSDFEGWTTKMTTLLEPLMILFMGGLVGTIVVVMLLSMVSVNEIAI